MSDSDIIKALECCTGLGCDKCKFNDGEPNTCLCEWELKNAAMEVLKRQQAEIEEAKRLKADHDALIRNYKECTMEVVREFAERMEEVAQPFGHGGFLMLTKHQINGIVAEMWGMP